MTHRRPTLMDRIKIALGLLQDDGHGRLLTRGQASIPPPIRDLLDEEGCTTVVVHGAPPSPHCYEKGSRHGRPVFCKEIRGTYYVGYRAIS